MYWLFASSLVCLTVICSESLSCRLRTVWVHPPCHQSSCGGPPRVINRPKQTPPFHTKGHTKHGAYLLHILCRYTYVFWSFEVYQGADKSLARPGRTQARTHVRDACNFNNIETPGVKSPARRARRQKKFTPLGQKH